MVDVDKAARRFTVLAGHLDERQRRLVLAVEATELGRGGVTALAAATGVARTTIQAGLRELAGGAGPAVLARGRSRQPGAGRKRATVADPGLAEAIEALAEPDAKGDPESPLRWTLKSTRQIAEALRVSGHRASSRTVAHVLVDELRYSLQANRKNLEGPQHPDRDAQFHYLNEQIRRHNRRREPVVSVDTKKSIWSGGSRGSDEMLGGPAGRGRRLFIGAVEPARSLAQGPSGPGIVAVSTNRRLV